MVQYQRRESTHLFTKLLLRAVIDSSADLVPADVGICQEPFINRGSRCQGQHDGTDGTQLVVHLSALGNVFGLEGDLQTTAPHAKSHGIHVDEVVGGSTVSHIIIFWPVVEVVVYTGVFPRIGGVLVVEDRDVDLDFPATPPADVGGQGGKTDMGVSNLIGHELRAQFRSRGRVVGISKHPGHS